MPLDTTTSNTARYPSSWDSSRDTWGLLEATPPDVRAPIRPTTWWRGYVTVAAAFLIVFGPALVTILTDGIGAGRSAPTITDLTTALLPMLTHHTPTSADPPAADTHPDAASAVSTTGRRRQLDEEQLRRLYVEEELPLREVAKRLGCSASLVRQRLAAAGIARRPAAAGIARRPAARRRTRPP